MSFFYDVFSALGIDDISNNLSINFVEEKGIVVVGNFKILTLNDELLQLKTKKNLIKIKGENLAMKTVSKGEIVVMGKVFSIRAGEKNVEWNLC